MTLFLAGHETTAMGMTWILNFLLRDDKLKSYIKTMWTKETEKGKPLALPEIRTDLQEMKINIKNHSKKLYDFLSQSNDIFHMKSSAMTDNNNGSLRFDYQLNCLF